MKKVFLIIGLGLVIASCNTKTSDKEEVKTDSIGITPNTDSASIVTDSHYYWSAELVPKEGLVMKKESPVGKDSLNVEFMISRLNETYPDVKLEFVKTSGDSVFIKIKKSNYLTEQMGSSGAEAYLAEVTYNLTEVKDINVVDIRFKEGDHASPGTYVRTDFVHVKN
ncbi:hypothetical protein BH11BAC4_BH11BAC4_18490 [soil metagenome]